MPKLSESLNEAVRLHQAGCLDQAEAMYCQIVRVDSAHANALHLLGVLQCQRGDSQAAVDYIRRAIAIDDSAALFHMHLGIAYRSLGQFLDAINSLEEAVRIDADLANAHVQLGICYEACGELTKAIAAFRSAVRLQPASADTYFRLGSALASADQTSEALSFLQTAVQLRPEDANSHNSLGSVLQKLGRLAEATAEYAAAVRLRPDFGPYHFNLGNALREQNLLNEAITSFETAVRLAPDDAEAQINLGVALKDQGRFDEALACCERLMHVNPNFAAARFNRSLILLQRGNLAEGWDEYQWRWDHGRSPKFPAQSEWDGSSLAHKSIFIHAEQGIGDEIMFSSCLPDILAQARQCTVECDLRLVPLFRRSFPAAGIVAKQRDAIAVPPAEVQIAIGSLPRFLRRSREIFPVRTSYLVADEHLLALWRRRYEDLGDGLKIGISWRGGKEADVRRKRSTALHQWSPILTVPGVRFINLQYGDCLDELQAVRQNLNVNILDWEDADPLRDLDNLAAQITALDLVISVDNATVHMAGALGRPVWTLLPFAADWRWLLGQSDTPWYPTVRLFRQGRPGDWETLFLQIREDLLQRKAEMGP